MGVDDVAATAAGASTGLGRGIAPVDAAFDAVALSLVAEALVAEALSLAAVALAFDAAALSFSFVAVVADFSFGLGAPPAELACKPTPRTPAIASAVKIREGGGAIKLSSSLPSGRYPTFIHLIILTKH